MSKFWYQIESYHSCLAPQKEAEYSGAKGKAKARRYCKQMSAIYTERDFVINGYDLNETWRNGKRI